MLHERSRCHSLVKGYRASMRDDHRGWSNRLFSGVSAWKPNTNSRRECFRTLLTGSVLDKSPHRVGAWWKWIGSSLSDPMMENRPPVNHLRFERHRLGMEDIGESRARWEDTWTSKLGWGYNVRYPKSFRKATFYSCPSRSSLSFFFNASTSFS